jgi:flagellar basal body-associated protein FliL
MKRRLNDDLDDFYEQPKRSNVGLVVGIVAAVVIVVAVIAFVFWKVNNPPATPVNSLEKERLIAE